MYLYTCTSCSRLLVCLHECPQLKQSAAPKQVCQYKFSLFALRLFGLLILLVTKSLHVDMGFEGFLWKTFVIKEN